MKNTLVSILSILFICNLTAQKVGIGTITPMAKLDVAGDSRVESMLIENVPGGSDLFRLSAITGSSMFDSQNEGSSYWGGDSSGWQTIIIDEEMTFDSIRMFFFGPQSLDTIKLFSGEWPNVTLLQALPMSDITVFQNYVASPWFNIFLSPGTYTIWLDNIKTWAWASQTSYPGSCSINQFIDFKFELYNHTVTVPLQVLGEGNASLDVSGAFSCDEFRLGNTANTGDVLTANAQGFGSWQPMPVNPWMADGGNLFYQGGHVGIGNNNPVVELDVTGKIRATQFQLTSGASNGYILSSDASGNGNWISNPVFWSPNGNNIYLNQTGNVGLGTTNPTSRLHLAAGAKIRIDGGVDTAPYFSLGGDGKFSIDAPNVPDGRFVILTGGNVGIGVTAPTAKLEVAGALKANAWKNCAMNANGYAEMGGVIMQWGIVNYNSNSNQTITFPVAFTQVYSVTATVDAGNNTGSGANVPVKTVNIGNNTFQIAGTGTFSGDNISKVRWMAVGN
ncbi:MAG TPA: hypothetical protein VFV79_08520 [Saprospiraceae bacterium]|nr:hypothetical protein [Saprospiraceae bacterium]